MYQSSLGKFARQKEVNIVYTKAKKKKVSPNVGLEPTTLRLRVSCSTD